MSHMAARSASRVACLRHLPLLGVQSRAASSGDIRARTTPGQSAKIPQSQHKEEKPVIKRIVNQTNTSDPSFKGAEEVIDEAYQRGGVKDGGIDKGPSNYKPASSGQASTEKDPMGKRKFSTHAVFGTASMRTYATKTPSKGIDHSTGERGVKVDHDVDMDKKKTGGGETKKPGMKSPVGQVIGKEGVESVDGGKHQESSDKLQNKERQHRSNTTTTEHMTVVERDQSSRAAFFDKMN